MKLEWNVYRDNFMNECIEVFNVFDHFSFYQDCCKIKKKFTNINDFSEQIRKSLMYYFWSKAEHEIVITTWPPRVNKQEVERLRNEVVNVRTYVNLTTGVKIDIFKQIELNWDKFINYLWNNRSLLK